MWCEKVEKVTCRATARIFIVAYAQTDSPEGRTGPAARSDVYDCPIHHHHHHYRRRRRRRIAREGRRVVAPPCPRSTARLQRSPVGRLESSRSWSSHVFRGRPGGRRHVRSGGRLSDTFTCR